MLKARRQREREGMKKGGKRKKLTRGKINIFPKHPCN
jgi:hypothetical protein